MSEKTKEKKPKGKVRKIIEWIGTGLFVALLLLVSFGEITSLATKKNNHNQPLFFNKYLIAQVKTNSMEPEYKVGSTIIAEKLNEKQINDRIIGNFNEKDINLSFFFEDNSYRYKIDDSWNIIDEFKDPSDYAVFTNPIGPGEFFPNGVVMTHQLFAYKVFEEKQFGQGKYLFAVHGTNTESTNYKPNQYQLFDESVLFGPVIGTSKVLGGATSFLTSPIGLIVVILIPAFYLIVSTCIDAFKKLKALEDEEENKTVTVNGEIKNNSGDTNNGNRQLSDEDKERLKKQLLEEMLKTKGGDK